MELLTVTSPLDVPSCGSQNRIALVGWLDVQT